MHIVILVVYSRSVTEINMCSYDFINKIVYISWSSLPIDVNGTTSINVSGFHKWYCTILNCVNICVYGMVLLL